MFEWNAYLIFLAVLAGSFLIVAIAALRWAFKTGQFNNLEAGSRVIFTEEEPEGVPQDHFPESKSKRKIQAAKQ